MADSKAIATLVEKPEPELRDALYHKPDRIEHALVADSYVYCTLVVVERKGACLPREATAYIEFYQVNGVLLRKQPDLIGAITHTIEGQTPILVKQQRLQLCHLLGTFSNAFFVIVATGDNGPAHA
jgi:hypothetical protein